MNRKPYRLVLLVLAAGLLAAGCARGPRGGLSQVKQAGRKIASLNPWKGSGNKAESAADGSPSPGKARVSSYVGRKPEANAQGRAESKKPRSNDAAVDNVLAVFGRNRRMRAAVPQDPFLAAAAETDRQAAARSSEEPTTIPLIEDKESTAGPTQREIAGRETPPPDGGPRSPESNEFVEGFNSQLTRLRAMMDEDANRTDGSPGFRKQPGSPPQPGPAQVSMQKPVRNDDAASAQPVRRTGGDEQVEGLDALPIWARPKPQLAESDVPADVRREPPADVSGTTHRPASPLPASGRAESDRPVEIIPAGSDGAADYAVSRSDGGSDDVELLPPPTPEPRVPQPPAPQSTTNGMIVDSDTLPAGFAEWGPLPHGRGDSAGNPPRVARSPKDDGRKPKRDRSRIPEK